MKNKTLAIITAALITAAALVLTAGLSLLNGSAIDEPVIDTDAALESAVDTAVSDIIAEDEEAVEDEIIVEDEVIVEDEPATEEAPVVDEIVDTRLPDLDTLEVVKRVAEGDSSYEWEYVLWRDIVIDVYEHSTGKLLGQVWITEDEIYDEFCEIFNADFDYTAELFNPNDPEDVPVFLPEAEYRVEFYWVERSTARPSGSYGSLAFSYGVENNEIYEFTQTGYPLGNGETVIAFMESLIAEKIAQIESGICDELEADDAFAHVIGLDGYWDGWTDPYTGEFYEGPDRYTPRFPYIAE